MRTYRRTDDTEFIGPIPPKSGVQYLTFGIPYDGLYRYTRLAMGIKVASEVFQGKIINEL